MEIAVIITLTFNFLTFMTLIVRNAVKSLNTSKYTKEDRKWKQMEADYSSYEF